DKWSVGFNIRYIRSHSDQRNGVWYGETANQVGQLVWGARQVDWSSLRDWRNLPTVNMVDSGDPRMVPINWNTAYNNNPFWALDNNLHPWERNRFMGGANIGYEINDKLRLDMQTGIDYFNDMQETQWHFGTNGNLNGYYRMTERNRYEINSQALLTYTDSYGANDEFDFNISAGGATMVSHYRLF